MAEVNKSGGIDLYYDKSKLKWIILSISVLISVGSIFYTNVLVNQLKERERRQIELYAKAIQYTLDAKLDKDLNFVSDEILVPNNSIPTILLSESGQILEYRNIAIDSTLSDKGKQQTLYKELEKMRDEYEPIEVVDRDEITNEIYVINYVYYRNSFLLTQLKYYPIVQLSVIAIIAFISYMAFDYSKAAEQNRVWVGLAKETAHQLGTPISSLMAWVEYFKDQSNIKDKNLIDELNKDIKKLQVITERFSNIGSTPALKEEMVENLINSIVGYLKPRISQKVSITVDALTEGIIARVNAPLFEWVIENLCKNAVDAMAGSGSIHIYILKGSEGRVFIDINDTGKGIQKSRIKQVFNPGFTTKKRGWGLGLTLAKRIIEIYHEGKIYIKSSEENKGTTFRIVLQS
ncbi:HAMP domain-containing histidine kinase [Fulvivirga sp. M361]|uniref:sensor histidine kinase n=1 Tax=Fulvivirga sp. M361 TaxID=2594266 RepID=UPI00117A006B|nr:HAMP domain-containing sensor histidine kinase [Fulvivirga sp. M361]TRX61291.1 HAMP domain-containing histidine kinase [Fulvivirga sp. M361]